MRSGSPPLHQTPAFNPERGLRAIVATLFAVALFTLAMTSQLCAATFYDFRLLGIDATPDANGTFNVDVSGGLARGDELSTEPITLTLFLDGEVYNTLELLGDVPGVCCITPANCPPDSRYNGIDCNRECLNQTGPQICEYKFLKRIQSVPLGPGVRMVAVLDPNHIHIELGDPTHSNNTVTSPPVGVAGESAPRASAITAVWPSPSHGSFSVAFSLAASGVARLRLYDIAGAIVAEQEENRPAGRYVTSWRAGRPRSSGLYFLQLRIADRSAGLRQVVLVH